MKKKIEITLIGLTIMGLVLFGGRAFSKTNTYKKYKLATMATLQGAKFVKVEKDSVSYDKDGSFTTVYEFNYGIKQLSGK